MNPYIIFNGVSSAARGYVIEKLPDIHRAQRNVEEMQIRGRDGSLIVDHGSYSVISTKLKLNPFGRSLSDVYAWLQGEGWLTTSDEPEFMRWASFYDQITDARFRCEGCYDSLTIPVRIWPYMHLAVQQPILCKHPMAFRGQGNMDAAPVLEVTGSGRIHLTVNGAGILIDDLSGSITIDCDARTAFTEADGVRSFAGRKVTILNDWPKLTPDDINAIDWSGSVTSVRIAPWWRWL